MNGDNQQREQTVLRKRRDEDGMFEDEEFVLNDRVGRRGSALPALSRRRSRARQDENEDDEHEGNEADNEQRDEEEAQALMQQMHQQHQQQQQVMQQPQYPFQQQQQQVDDEEAWRPFVLSPHCTPLHMQLGMSLVASPGIMRVRNANLFSPMRLDATPFRANELLEGCQTPHVGFFQTPKRDTAPLVMFSPQLMHQQAPYQLPQQQLQQQQQPSAKSSKSKQLQQQRVLQLQQQQQYQQQLQIQIQQQQQQQLQQQHQQQNQQHVALGFTVGQPCRSSVLQAINMKIKETPSKPGALVAKSVSSPDVSSPAVFTPLAGLPSVTLFNGGRSMTAPVEEALASLRKSDRNPLFGAAEQLVNASKRHKPATFSQEHEDLNIVADAASQKKEQPSSAWPANEALMMSPMGGSLEQ